MGIAADNRLTLVPVSRGNFSAIHVSSLSDPRPYADAEFAFKGAKDHMRWWFRKPAFESGLVRLNTLYEWFDDLGVRDNGEATTDLRTVVDAEKVLDLLGELL